MQQLNERRYKFVYIIYFCMMGVITIIILPVREMSRAMNHSDQLRALLASLKKGPDDELPQLPISSIYPVFSRNPYRGKWMSSFKRSQFLESEEGLIELRTIYNSSQQQQNYYIKIRICDGMYRDKLIYDISLDSASMIVKQRFEPGKVLYETESPLIGFYKKGQGLHMGTEDSLYLNKVKIKLTGEFDIKVQILISSQYSINVIARDVHEYSETFYDILFSFFLILQCLIQSYGIYHVHKGIVEEKESELRYSWVAFLMATALDVVQATGITLLCSLSEKRFVFYILPVLMFWTMILFLEIRVFTLLYNRHYRNDSCKFALKMYAFFFLLCLTTYAFNFNSFFFIFSSCCVLLPQIMTNYMVGHKLKNNMKYFICYSLPRYWLISYLRMNTSNVLILQPKYILGVICYLIIILQVGLILAQIKYGVHSILPKLLQSSEFKYFISQPEPEDINCSICLIPLKQRSPEQSINVPRNNNGEDIFNNVVLTPCNHKFHIECLVKWMENKLQCPNCRTILPPIEDYQ